MSENKPCRHAGKISGRIYKGNCEDCVIEKWEVSEARVDRLEKALKHIIKHQDIVGGTMAELSTTRKIAKEALGEENYTGSCEHNVPYGQCKKRHGEGEDT